MKKLVRNVAALALVGVMAFAAVGCGRGGDDAPTTAPGTPAGTPAQGATPAPGTPPPAGTPTEPLFSYPMNTNVVLTYWVAEATNHQGIVENIGQTRIKQNLMAATGITVDFWQPTGATAAEGFNVLIATAQFPHIVQANWHANFPGGVAGALNDGVIIPLNEPMAQWAPNFMAILDGNAEVRRAVHTDDGVLFVFPFLRIDYILRTSTGPMIRADWLAAQGLAEPVTIADWENMLTVFRDVYGASFSGVASGGNPNGLHQIFSNAFGLRPHQTNGFNLRPGSQEVFWSGADEGFRAYWETMIRWFDQGLIDPDITAANRARVDGGVLGEDFGAWVLPVGGGMGPLLSSPPHDQFDIVAVRWPVLNAGDRTYFQGTANVLDLGSWGHAGITVTAERDGVVMYATRFLDFGYSEEGATLMNWGEYGLVWEWEDQAAGVRRYTDYIHNHPGGRNFAQALSYHALAPMNGPFPQDGGYMPQFAARPQQRNALQIWNFGHDAIQTLLPPVSFTTAEADAHTAHWGDINTHFTSTIAQWLIGETQLNDATWAAYLNTLESLGINTLVQNHQAAVDRFFRR